MGIHSKKLISNNTWKIYEGANVNQSNYIHMLNQKYAKLKLFNVIHIKVERNRNILDAQISIPKLFLVLFFFHWIIPCGNLLLSALSGEMTSRCLSLHLKEEITLLLRTYVRSYVSYMKERHIQERSVNRDYVHKKNP